MDQHHAWICSFRFSRAYLRGRAGAARLFGLAALLLVPNLAIAVTPGAGTPSAPFAGKFNWLIVRCHAKDETAEPQSTAYFEQLFTNAGKGTKNMVDYWHDASFAKISVADSVVAQGRSADSKGWYTLPITQSQYDKLSREQEVEVCANRASPDYNLGKFYGVIAIYPETDTGASGGDADNYGPISNSFAGVNGAGAGTFTLSLVNLPSNVNPTFAGHEMGHGFGLHHSRLLSTPTVAYHDGYDIMSAMATDSFAPPTGDKTNALYGGSNLNSLVGAKGPGPDAITRDDEGWIPQDRLKISANPDQTTIHMHSLTDPDALASSNSGALAQSLEWRIPTKVSFPFTPPTQNTCASSYYTLEYRESRGWDAGIPVPASYWNPTDPNQLKELNNSDFPIGSVVMHLICVSSWNPPPPSYGFSFLVDVEPSGGGHVVEHNGNLYPANGPNGAGPLGAYFPGDEFGDVGTDFYFAANSMSNKDREALVTVAYKKGPIKDKLTLTAPATAASGSELEVSALLATDPPPAANVGVVPGHKITFKIGTSHCDAITDLDGTAKCSLTAEGSQFTKVTLSADAEKTRAYLAANASKDINLGPGRPTPTPSLTPPVGKVVLHRPAAPKRPDVMSHGDGG